MVIWGPRFPGSIPAYVGWSAEEEIISSWGALRVRKIAVPFLPTVK
jgi:hypothetical protein